MAEEEANFGPENPSLEERAFLGAEIEADGVEESGIDGEECSEDGEEARVPKIRRAPRGPTQLEREQHEALHLPYRDWYGRCVRGAGERHLTGGKVSRQKMTRRTKFSGWCSIIIS